MAVNMTLHRWPRLGAVTAKRLNHPRKERKLQKAALIRRVMIAPCRIIIVYRSWSGEVRIRAASGHDGWQQTAETPQDHCREQDIDVDSS